MVIATRLVEAEGLDALQARRIAKEADCAVGSLYNVFGDIDGLISAVNGRTLGRLGEQLSTALGDAKDGDVRARLLALALSYVRFAVNNRRAWDAVFKHRRAAGNPVPQAYVDDQLRLIAVIEGVIAGRSVDAGTRGTQARALFGAIHGIVSLALDDRLGGIARAELEPQVRFMVDVITRGLPTPAPTTS
ncbi:MAG: TetR/AcrR family transcriptional regulator [Hyphomicrobiaceae bacterium]